MSTSPDDYLGRGGGSEGAGDHRALDLLDGLRDLDAAGARLGAVEGRAAAPHALLVVEDLEALRATLVTAVEDEAVRVDDRGRAEVLAVRPEHRAGRRARGAEDALGRVVDAGAVLGGLVALA